MFLDTMSFPSFWSNRLLQQIGLTGQTLDLGKYIQFYYSNIDEFVNVFVADKVLEFEFFKESNNLRILIVNVEKKDIKYNEVTNTVRTFHLMVGVHDWESGFYDIYLNNEQEIFLRGNFNL